MKNRSRTDFPRVTKSLPSVLTVLIGAMLLAGWPIGAVTPALAPRNQIAKAKAEAEFTILRQRDAEAREDFGRWLRDTEARDEHMDDRSPNFLSARMEHRINTVSAAFTEFLARYPEHSEATALQAAFREDMATNLEAIRRWEEERSELPDSPAPWNRLAHHLTHVGRIVDAFACFEKSLELAPREADYFFDYATALLLYRNEATSHYKLTESELFDRVLITYRRGMKLQPDDYQLAADYANTFYMIRPARPAEGLSAWEGALKLATTESQRDEVRLHLARYSITSGKLGIARLYLDQVRDSQFDPVKASLLRRIEDAAKATPKAGS